MSLYRIIRRGSDIWRFHPFFACSIEKDAGKRHVFHTAFSARYWIEDFQSEPALMAIFRGLVAKGPQPFSMSRMSDSQVVSQLARLLASGNWHVHHSRPPRVTGLINSPVLQPETPRSAPKQSRPASSPPPPPDPATFANQLDVSAMVKSLVQAAASNAPFCEECAKAMASR
jgi:hypothetical protein